MKSIITFITILIFSITLSGQTKKADLVITHLKGDFYIYTTYKIFKETPVSANGLYLVTKDGVVLIDSPWDTTQFQPLLDSIKLRHGKDVVMCLATHSHEDRTGGLDYYKQKGIKTYTTKQTDQICKERNEKRAKFLISNDTSFTIGQYSFQTYYGGQGHTADNIVVWFKEDKILYGGCLVKSTEAVDLGYLGDANRREWPITIKKIQKKFRKPNYIIPGHQGWTNKKSLEHTLKLLKLYDFKVD
jgi:metallo-beta-lactamase class B